MKILVCVIIYDRLENLRKWVTIWQRSNTRDAEIVFIHNGGPDEVFKETAQTVGLYIARENIGFDIGAFQDVCNDRINLDFDIILWCTDDLLPIKGNFIYEFLYKLTPEIKAVCYELSNSVRPHMRTTGFMMRREDLKGIKFKVDPIKTKSDCYDFEHRDSEYAILDQLKDVVQVSELKHSPMWDSGNNSRSAMAIYHKRKAQLRKFLL
jgi:hypothetical protein